MTVNLNLLVGIIGVVFCCFFIILFIRSYASDTEILKQYKILCICVCVFYGIHYLGVIIQHSIPDSLTVFIIYTFLHFLGYSGGVISLYFLLLQRLKYVFQNSALALSNTYYNCYVINLCILVLLLITDYIIHGISQRIETKMPIIWIYIQLCAEVIGNVLGTFGLFSVVHLFNHRLSHLALLQKTSISCYTEEDNKSNLSESLNVRQIKLLHAAAKNTILSSIIVSVETLDLITLAVMVAFGRGKFSWFLVNWYELAFLLVISIQIPCVYLGLRVNKNVYQRLCGPCERLCIVSKAKKVLKHSNDYRSLN